jgi:hypothetical protein
MLSKILAQKVWFRIDHSTKPQPEDLVSCLTVCKIEIKATLFGVTATNGRSKHAGIARPMCFDDAADRFSIAM